MTGVSYPAVVLGFVVDPNPLRILALRYFKVLAGEHQKISNALILPYDLRPEAAKLMVQGVNYSHTRGLDRDGINS